MKSVSLCSHLYCSQQFCQRQEIWYKRANLKFCVKFENSVTKTEAMGWMQCFEEHGHFKSRQISLEYNEWSGGPGNVKEIHQLVCEDCTRTMRDIISNVIGLSYGSMQVILISEMNTHGMSVPSLSSSCWPLSRKRIMSGYVKISLNMPLMTLGECDWCC